MARQWWRPGRASTRRPASRVAALVAADADAVGVHLGGAAHDDSLAPARLLTLPPGGEAERRLFLALHGPLDFVVDDLGPEGGAKRFQQYFFHLRPGGRYVVVGGAAEVGDDPGQLGLLLREGQDAVPGALRSRASRLPVSGPRALRDHVRWEVVGDDLVVSHDLDDVLVKLPESVVDDYISAVDRHDVVVTIGPDTPDLPSHRDLPVGPEKHARPVEDVTLSLRDYREVVVGPQQVVLDGRVILPDSYRHPRSRTLRSNVLVDLARPFAVPLAPLPDDLPSLPGTFLHLDNEARGHFGHLLTETVSRTWAWAEAVAVDPDVRALVCATPKRPALLGYELAILEACGIPRDRVTLLDGPARVERLLSGTPMFSNPHFVHGRIAATWDAVGERLLAGASERSWPARLFLGRRETKRACLNAADLEAEFTRRGFEVVFPEEHSLGDQVRMFREAEVIAGYAGSGMFQLAFVPEPKRVVQVTSDAYNPRNELLIAAVRKHRIDRVLCRSVEQPATVKGTQTDFWFDPEREGPALEELLGDLA